MDVAAGGTRSSRPRLAASNLILSGFSTCWVTRRNGRKTAGTKTTSERRLMAAPGQAEHVNHAFCEAITGAIFHGFCALPIAQGTSLVNAPTISGFASRGHSLEAEAALTSNGGPPALPVLRVLRQLP